MQLEETSLTRIQRTSFPMLKQVRVGKHGKCGRRTVLEYKIMPLIPWPQSSLITLPSSARIVWLMGSSMLLKSNIKRTFKHNCSHGIKVASSKILAFDNLYSHIHFTHASLDALRLSFHYQAKRAGSKNHLQVNSVTRKFPGVVGQLACGGSLFHEGFREGYIWNGMGQ